MNIVSVAKPFKRVIACTTEDGKAHVRNPMLFFKQKAGYQHLPEGTSIKWNTELGRSGSAGGLNERYGARTNKVYEWPGS
jgi:hypothetical protein